MVTKFNRESGRGDSYRRRKPLLGFALPVLTHFYRRGSLLLVKHGALHARLRGDGAVRSPLEGHWHSVPLPLTLAVVDALYPAAARSWRQPAWSSVLGMAGAPPAALKT